jgi:hypothetical protein
MKSQTVFSLVTSYKIMAYVKKQAIRRAHLFPLCTTLTHEFSEFIETSKKPWHGMA